MADIVRAAKSRPAPSQAQSNALVAASPLLTLFEESDLHGMAPLERMTLAKLATEISQSAP